MDDIDIYDKHFDWQRKTMADEHGSCPHCGYDLNGGLIWDHFYHTFLTEGDWLDEYGTYHDERTILNPDKAAIRADEVAKSYGATRTTGRWGKKIGIERDRDRIEEWMCPNCEGTWKR